MRSKIIALDIDGTLITSARKISDQTKTELRKAHANGCKVVLATGRAYMSLQDVLAELGCADFAVTSNGGGIFTDKGEQIYSANMPRDMVYAVCAVCESLGITPEVYIKGQAYCSLEQIMRLTERGVPESVCGYIRDTRVAVPNFADFVRERVSEIEGMDILVAPQRVRSELVSGLCGIDGLCVTSSSPWYIDANVAGVNKASGLAHLCEILGVSMADVMAFGDAENDVEMLEMVGVGVAMGNACDKAKAAADYITDSNDENGIANMLKSHP